MTILQTLFSDAFNYDDGALSAQDNWQLHNTTAGTDQFTISGNVVSLPATAARKSTQVIGSFANDQWASVDVIHTSTNAFLDFGVGLCFSAPGTTENHFRFLVKSVGGGNNNVSYSISRFVAGTSADLIATGQRARPESPFTLRARKVGSNLYLDLNGTQLLTVSDSSFSGGTVGLTGFAGGSAEGWRLDNFQAGNIVSTAINPTGTDVTAYPGQSRTAVMQNVVATPNAIAYVYNDTIVSTHSDFDWTAGDDGAGTITYTVEQGNLPYGNTDLVIRVSFDSGDPVTLDGMELTVEPDYQYVVAAGTLVTETEESIWFGYEGDTPVAGYQTHTPKKTSDARTITVNADGTWVVGAGNGSSPDGYSFPVRVWDGEDWDSYTVTVDLGGGVDPEPGDGDGLTSVGFTAEGFTVRGFTARGF